MSKKTAAIILLLMITIGNTIMFAQTKYCRYEIHGSDHYGRVEGKFITELDKAPWLGGSETGERIELEKVKLLHPSEPQVILGLGSSYKQSWVGKTPPKTVRWFLKPPTSAGNPDDNLILPASLNEIKVEVELVIVIGKRIKNASPEEAAKAIFGYTIGNDIVGNKQSYLEKNNESPESAGALLGSGLKIGDGFEPFGPFIYQGIDWKNRAKKLTITSAVGEQEVEYSENTSDILYTPEKIVSDLSKVLTLNPGDIISSGTAKSFTAGIGDIVTIEIDGLGKFSSKIVAKK